MRAAALAIVSLLSLGCGGSPAGVEATDCAALAGRLLGAPERRRLLVIGSNFTTGVAFRIDPATMQTEPLSLGVTGDTVARMAGDALVLLHRSQTQGDNLTLFDARPVRPRYVCQLALSRDDERVRGLRPWVNAHDVVALDASTLAVARYNLGSLAVIDLQRGALTRTVDLTAFQGRAALPYPDAMARVGDEIWVSLQRLDDLVHPTQPGLIVRFDAALTRVVGTLALPYANPYGPFRRLDDGRVALATLGDYSVIGDGGLLAIDPQSQTVTVLRDEAALGSNLDGFVFFDAERVLLKRAGARDGGGGEVGVRFTIEGGDAPRELVQRALWAPAFPEVMGALGWVGDPGRALGDDAAVRAFTRDGDAIAAFTMPDAMRPYDLLPVP